MVKFRTKLTVIFITLIGLSIVTGGMYMAQKLEQSHIAALQDHMKREIRVMLAMMEWEQRIHAADSGNYFNSLAIQLKQSAAARVTFVRNDGIVLGDSDHAPSTMDNHAFRKEIMDAKQFGEGYSIRYSETIQENMLYVAIPMQANDSIAGYVRLSLSLKDVEQTIHKLWSTLIAGLAVFFVIAALISYRLAWGLTRPLEQIIQVAQEITNSNYNSRVPISRRDEIGKLGLAINRMADSLKLQMHRIREDERQLKSVLENMVSGVFMIDRANRIVLLNPSAENILGVDSAELLGKKYDEAKQQLELTKMINRCMERHMHIREELVLYFPFERTLEVNLVPMLHDDGEWAGVVVVLHDITDIRRLERVRSEFVANVSHELKTPIAAVKGFAETLLAGAMDDKETAKSFLKIIFDESERLNRLIGDILELSKIESRRIPLHFSPIDMQAFVGKALEMMLPSAEQKHITLDMHVTEDLYIEADEDRLHQIMINLLSNGINYTPDGGKVSVRVEPVYYHNQADYDKIRLTISDTGFGIPKKDLPRIFERFYRVDKARSRSSGGTGLGLSIVKHLVDLHKGSIRVESEIGMGSKFMIDLPVIQ